MPKTSVRKIQLGPRDILFPVPAALVVSGTPENPNILTVAWIGIMSSVPPTIAISLKKSRHSLELIRKSGEFTVNIPPSSLFRETDYCGIVSGTDHKKFDDTNLTPLKSAKIRTPIISECPFNMECKVLREIEVGGWVMVLGDILETHIDEDKIDKSKTKIDIGKVDPLVYCATVREYWQLGKKLGDGFKAGLEITPQK